MKPPYYAVIFTAKSAVKNEEYHTSFNELRKLAQQMDGYLGFENYHGDNGESCAISYWENMEVIKKWKAIPAHLQAQKKGRDNWYNGYTVRICKVDREYAFNQEGDK